jgi:hypothetical protein
MGTRRVRGRPRMPASTVSTVQCLLSAPPGLFCRVHVLWWHSVASTILPASGMCGRVCSWWHVHKEQHVILQTSVGLCVGLASAFSQPTDTHSLSRLETACVHCIVVVRGPHGMGFHSLYAAVLRHQPNHRSGSRQCGIRCVCVFSGTHTISQLAVCGAPFRAQHQK